MTKKDIEKWGEELKPEEFAGALAFLLHQLFEEAPAGIPAEYVGLEKSEKLLFEIETNDPISLFFDPENSNLDYYLSTPASDYHERWKDFLEATKSAHYEQENERSKKVKDNYNEQRFHLRLELYTYPENVFWLTEKLSFVNYKEVSVYLRTAETGNHVGWNWALEVGFLRDERSQELRNELENTFDPGLRHLVEFVNLDHETDNCDLLLIPDTLHPNINSALSLKIKVSADCVLLIGESGERPKELSNLMEALRRFISTSGIGIVDVPLDKKIDWFRQLIRELSHNEPIDVALFEACRKTEISNCVLIASRRLVKFSKLAESIKSLGKKLKKRKIEKSIDILDEDGWNFGIDKGSYSVDKLGSILLNYSDKFRYDRESTSATSAARINKEIKSTISKEKTLKKNVVRWIQSQIYDLTQKDKPKRLYHALRSNAPHKAVVRIGTASDDWVQSDEEFRSELLPPDKDSYELTVVFTEPQLFDGAKIATIILPSEGDSTECEFTFEVAENIKEIEARISIFYKNRVLQTALLKAKVLADPQEASDKNKMELTREAIVRTDFSGLHERRYFDAAFILNDDLSGQPKMTAIRDKFVSFSTPEGLKEFSEYVDKTLTDLAEDSEYYFGDLDNKNTVSLLCNLAMHGRILRDSLYKYQDGASSTLELSKIMNDLAEDDPTDFIPRRIQIVSAKPDTRLPFEFLYNRLAPEHNEAKLCPNFLDKSVEEGKCLTDCPGIQNPEDHVCPLGFWGLANIIERHTHSTMHTRETVKGDFRFQAEPKADSRRHLDVFKKAIFAGSDIADILEENLPDGSVKKTPDQFKKITSLLTKVTNSTNEISKIKSWESWCESIKTENPSALVLISHTKKTGGIEAIEIENGDPEREKLLRSSSINWKHVRFPKENLPPIVFLMGCETGSAKIDYSSFVARFSLFGAAIIISTGASILGHHAIPVTEQLLESLYEFTQKPGVSFGEVMRVVKHKMLAKGYPMVLTLMTYGDADWQIGNQTK